MNIKEMLFKFMMVIFGLSATMGLPAQQSNTPSTTTATIATTANPHLMVNPCGSEIDLDSVPTETEFQQSLDELSPNTRQIQKELNGLKSYMSADRIQSSMMRKWAEKTAAGIYPSDVFPHPPTDYFSDNLFKDLYTNMSMTEIYYSNLKEDYDDDNDAEILSHITEIIDASQRIRCHLQIIVRFYDDSIPAVDFTVEESKINSGNRSRRYFKHYQIYHLTTVFISSLIDFLSNL